MVLLRQGVLGVAVGAPPARLEVLRALLEELDVPADQRLEAGADLSAALMGQKVKFEPGLAVWKLCQTAIKTLPNRN